MDLADLIAPEAVIASLKARNKKQALHELAQRAGALTGVDARDILDTLLQRERLGSTGIGRGIAIPHGRLGILPRIVSLFARLEEPIEFDALDNEPVDLIFLLLAPEHAGADHLKALARISRLLREPSNIERLRASKDRAALYSVLTEPAVHAA
ncbi:MAG TPA: PTS IIA-like nitrogen regulatory protein PtsN [Hyphomicrobiaceae bacterium]|jgi:PTS system nitrogen regulatory IIA component|nr:PTS IIA-like nitrogen regulatory protein PtsN [Hyphomicrobiaceae bacterium]